MSIQVSNDKVRIDGDSRFVLRDGTEQTGRILVSDSEGNASWKSGRSLVGNDRYIGEIYGGGVVVGIWRDSLEEKVLIVFRNSLSGYLYDLSNGYGINSPTIPWAQRPSNITITPQLSEDVLQTGAWSSHDGAYNNMMAYNYVKQTSGRKFSGISQFYNYPTLLFQAGLGLTFDNLNGYSDWYVPSIQEMRTVMDNALIVERAFGGTTNGFLGPKDEAFSSDRQFFWTSTEKLDYTTGNTASRAWAYDKRSDKMVARLKTSYAEIILVRTETTKWIQSPQKKMGVNLINDTPFTTLATMCLDATDKLSYNDSRMPNRWTDTITHGLTSSRSFYVNPAKYNAGFGGYFSFEATGLYSGDTVSGSIFNPRSVYYNTGFFSVPEYITMELWTRPRKPSIAGSTWEYTVVSFPAFADSSGLNPRISFSFDETLGLAYILIYNNAGGLKNYQLPIGQVLNNWNHLVVSASYNFDTTAGSNYIVVWVNSQRLTATSNTDGFSGSSPFYLNYGTVNLGTTSDIPPHVGSRVGNFCIGGNADVDPIDNYSGFDSPSGSIAAGSYYTGDIALFRTFDRLLANSETKDLYDSRKDVYATANAGTTHAIDQGPGPGTFSVVQKLQLVLPGRKNMKVLRATANGTASWVEKNYLFYRPDNKREVGDYYGGGIIVSVHNYPANVYNYTIMSLNDIAGPYLGTFSFGRTSSTIETKNEFRIQGWDLASELTYYQSGGGSVPNAPNSTYPLTELYNEGYVYDPKNDAYQGLGYWPLSKTSYNSIPLGSRFYGRRAINYQNGVTTITSLQENQYYSTPGNLSTNARMQLRSTWLHRNIGYRWRVDSIGVTGAMSMYDGIANTNAILALGGPTWSAAAACRLFSLDAFSGSEGFGGWYLPAIYELEQAFKNLVALSSKAPRSLGWLEGGSTPMGYYHGRPLGLGGTYWSSTDFNDMAWAYTVGNNVGHQASNQGYPADYTGGWPEQTGTIFATKDKRFFVRAFRKVSVLANYKTWGEPSPNDEPALDWYIDPFDEKNWTPYAGLKKNAVFNVDTDRPPSYDGRFNGWSSLIYNRQNGIFGTPSTGTVLQGVTWSSTEVALYFNGTWSAPGTLFRRDSYIEFNSSYGITVGTPWAASDVIEMWVKPTHELSTITTARGIVCTHGFSVDSTNPVYATRVYAGYCVSLSANDGSDTYRVIAEFGNGTGAGSLARRSFTTAARPVVKDKWNHIVVRFTNLGKTVTNITIWVNGKIVGSTGIALIGAALDSNTGLWVTGTSATVDNVATNTKMLIGCLWVGAKYVFEGWIGKVRTYVEPPYSSTISNQEVSDNYEKDRVRYNAAKALTYPVEQDSLVLHLDASSYLGGGIWADLSGNFIESSDIYEEARVYCPDTTLPTFTSVASSAGYLTMASNYFQLPNNAAVANFPQGITIIVIADFGNADAAERLIDLGSGQGSNNILFGRAASGNNLYFQIYNGSTLSLSTALANGVLPNKWGFYGVRTSSTSNKIFNQFTSATYNTNVVPVSTFRSSSYIGKSNWAGDATFSGKLAVVAIWRKPLTDRQIDDFYNFYKNRYGL